MGMTTPRLTQPTIGVLRALLNATDTEPVWGLSICATADLGPGTVYPILTRLYEHQWVTNWEETTPHPGRPARRFWKLTDHGRTEAEAALVARNARRRTTRYATEPKEK
jgi:Predicted transcriptional regulators